MSVSNRQRQILELLLNRKGEMTAAEIAAAIKVSARTVHRELLELEPILAECGVALQKKSGIGIQIQAGQEEFERLRSRLYQLDPVEYSAEERKTLALCLLLDAREPVKLFSLAHDLRVTAPTVTHDLDELEEWLGRFGLSLIRRRGYGVLLGGSEADQRRVIGHMAQEHLDTSELFGLAADRPVHSVTGRLLEMLGKDNWTSVEQALWRLEAQWPVELSEVAYTDLLIRLSVAIARIQRGRRIERTGGRKPPSGPTKGEAVDQLLRHLSESLKLDIPEEEAGYIAELLRWEERAGGHRRLLPQEDPSLMETVQRLIRYMEVATGSPFHRDRSLRDGLLHHIEPALQRIGEGIQVRNPLLAQIKKDYETLFGFVRQAVDHIVTRLKVPDEEIGFLVMHFGASLERLKQFSRNVKALIVCTSGIGSSKLLAIRVEKELPQIEIVGQVSWYEAARIPGDEYDLILSTVELPLEPDQYFKLSPLLAPEEAEKLRRFVQDITLKRNPAKQAASPKEDPPLERLRSLKAYLDEMVYLLDRFKVYPLETDGADLRETLLRACGKVGGDGALDRIEPIVEQLVERETQGSQVIPDTQLALFHTRSEHCHQPLLSLFRLSGELILDAEEPARVRQVLLMLGPRQLSKESLEVLSEISSLLLLPEMVRQLEGGTTEDIIQFIAAELTGFFENKTETGRII